MASRLIDLISKKTNCTCSTLFVFLCRCFAQLQRCFVGLKRQTSELHIIFMKELWHVLTQYFVSCVHVRFIFHCRSFSPCWPLAFHSRFEFSCFSSYKICLFCLQSLFLSVIHVSVNIKNNVEKDTTLFLFFLSKSPGCHAISFQIKP